MRGILDDCCNIAVALIDLRGLHPGFELLGTLAAWTK